MFKRGLYRFKYNYAKYLNLRKPVDVSIELTSQCNMSCNYCYHAADDKDLPFQKGFMDLTLAKQIIVDAAFTGVNSLKFNWRGESTLHPNYTEITEFAKSLASGSTFIDRLANSNFKIPKRRRDDKFKGLATLTKVKISYDSFDKGVFEKQRAGGNHDLTTENIDLFYNHPDRIKSETQIVIQAVRTNLNKDEDIEHNIKKRWPDAIISIRDVVAGRVDKDVTEYINKGRDFSNREPCTQAFARLIIHHDGRVNACCPATSNDLILGDFKTQTIKEIFNGKPAKSLRQRLKNKTMFHLNPCKTCSSFESYKGHKKVWES
jgi:radical SAM protein with 4Fe4S-binding SPASM domain